MNQMRFTTFLRTIGERDPTSVYLAAAISPFKILPNPPENEMCEVNRDIGDRSPTLFKDDVNLTVNYRH